MRSVSVMILLSGLVTAGCADLLQLHPEVATPGAADADTALIRALANIDHAMAQLQPRIAAAAARDTVDVPAELLRPFDMNLTGIPIEQAAGVLATFARYRFRVSRPDGLPTIPVTIISVRQPLVALFRSIGTQGGANVDVNVNADNRTVEVIYHKEA